MSIRSAKELEVYKLAYSLSLEICELTRQFAAEERFALTTQVRRSSRSVCLNRREAWAKRRYEAHFVSKLTDCDGEASETDSSLDYAKDCGYIEHGKHRELTEGYRRLGGMLGKMIKNPKPFLIAKE